MFVDNMYDCEERRGAAEGKLLPFDMSECREHRAAGRGVEDKPDLRHDSGYRAYVFPRLFRYGMCSTSSIFVV